MLFISPRELRKMGVLAMNRRNNEYIAPCNPRSRYPLVDDKLLTKRAAEAWGMAVPGLCGVIDRALERHPRGETFVYGIHQKVAPGVLESLKRHYVGSGWSSVALREGATGSHLLVLAP